LRKPRFYGWYIVGAALVAQFVAVGTQGWASGIFLKPMTEDLGWTREQYSLVQTVSTFVMGGVGFFIGAQIDRRGPRLLMFSGALISGTALIATSRVQELWQFYLLRGVAQTVGNAMIGNLVVNVTVAKWFVARRGMAIAISSAGLSLSGVVMVPVIGWWVSEFGWRSGWVLLGLVAFVLVLPSCYVMRRAPEDMGLLPDGMTRAQAEAFSRLRKRASAVSEVQWTRPEAVRTSSLWMVILAYGLAQVGMGGNVLHSLPLLTDAGFSRSTGAWIFTAQAWSALIAKPFWGLLMDRFHARQLSAVTFVIIAFATVGTVAAAHTGSIAFASVVFVIYGLGAGGNQPLQETVWASYFGREHLGKIRAIAMPFSIVFGAGGPLLAGYLYDKTGDYVIAYSVFGGLALLGFLFIMLAKPPRRRGEPRTYAGPAPDPEPAAVALRGAPDGAIRP
jgi:sugar phosphate permease